MIPSCSPRVSSMSAAQDPQCIPPMSSSAVLGDGRAGASLLLLAGMLAPVGHDHKVTAAPPDHERHPDRRAACRSTRADIGNGRQLASAQ
jgi:hypothetical protein